MLNRHGASTCALSSAAKRAKSRDTRLIDNMSFAKFATLLLNQVADADAHFAAQTVHIIFGIDCRHDPLHPDTERHVQISLKQFKVVLRTVHPSRLRRTKNETTPNHIAGLRAGSAEPRKSDRSQPHRWTDPRANVQTARATCAFAMQSHHGGSGRPL